MADILKRGNVWYSNFVVKVYGEDGRPARDHGGNLIYEKIRWALHEDKELAQEENSRLLRLRREADKNRANFKTYFEQVNGHSKGSTYVGWRDAYLAKRKAEFKGNTHDHDDRAFRELDRAAAALGLHFSGLSDITPRVLDRIKTQWIIEGKKPSAINRALRAIKQAMREAAGFGEVSPHDWLVVKKAKGEAEHKTHFFTIEEARRMRDEMPGHYKTIAYLGNRGGRRLGEIYHLQWSGIDFEQNTIKNDKIKGVWEPKSKKSYEAVPMKKDLRAYLMELKKTATDAWVIPRKGIPGQLSMGTYFRRLLRGMGIAKGSAHTCRHTFASHLIQAGTDIYAVSKLMRHSSIKQTEKYAHLRKLDLDRMVQGLPDL